MHGPTAGIILAAGESTRFGRPKQLARLAGVPLIERVLAAALASRLDQVLLVLGCGQAGILQALGRRTADPRCRVLIAPEYRRGQGESLKTGVRAVEKSFPSAMFLLGDQPFVGPMLIDHMLARSIATEKLICFPVHGDRRGHPIVFDRRLYPALLEIRGDKGAREVVAARLPDALAVEIPDPTPFFDVDTPEDLAHATGLVEPAPSNSAG